MRTLILCILLLGYGTCYAAETPYQQPFNQTPFAPAPPVTYDPLRQYIAPQLQAPPPPQDHDYYMRQQQWYQNQQRQQEQQRRQGQ